MKNMRFGDLLISKNIITEEQLLTALKEQRESKEKLGKVLLRLGYITEKVLIEVLQMQYGIPYYDLNIVPVDKKIPKLITEELARQHILIPIKFENDELVVVMEDPLDIVAQDDIKFATNLNVKPAIGTHDQIIKAIERYYDNAEVTEQAIGEYTSQEAQFVNVEKNIEDIEVQNAPMVRLVNSILKQAIRSRASDIHVEPFEKIVRIRMRVDGTLREVVNMPIVTHPALTTRIKILAGMNISERRLPQDGRIETEIDNKHIDMRISSLPTVFGEKIVIRILDRTGIMRTKSDLGFSYHNEKIFDNLLNITEGIILVTGPTGSGKSTTLYTVLRELNKDSVNIITVEDPVEYRLEGINQVQTNERAGLTFASTLRSILRQDPDIIMLGEIRDLETAEIAIRASITGHIVLSTLHTNDAASTLTRLVDMGMEPYIVSTAIKGILAQRLVKKLCNYCKTEYIPDVVQRKFLNINDNDTDIKLYKAVGCTSCNGTGYSGRTAIHEILVVNTEIQKLMNKGADSSDLKESALNNGMKTLRDSAIELVKNGVTTFDEALRATFSIED